MCGIEKGVACHRCSWDSLGKPWENRFDMSDFSDFQDIFKTTLRISDDRFPKFAGLEDSIRPNGFGAGNGPEETHGGVNAYR